MRGFRNLTTKQIDGALASHAKRFTKNILNRIIRVLFGINVPMHFGSLTDYISSLKSGFDPNKSNGKNIELMVHPGNNANGYPYLSEILWLENNFRFK
jgi:hypothetical protein